LHLALQWTAFGVIGLSGLGVRVLAILDE